MIEGILGRKLGMTRVYDKRGIAHAATLIAAGPCVVTQIRTAGKDGYEAVQLGFGVAKRLTKPMRGHLGKLGNFRHLHEFGAGDVSAHSVGDKVGPELFAEGDYVDVTGKSKGRGFAGGVKRWGFHGGPKTHGQSDRHRAPGAIGSGTSPGRVLKGLHMAGHMGDERVTVPHMKVLESDPAKGLLVVAGAVPGAKNGLVYIRWSKRGGPQVQRVFEPEAVEPEPEAIVAEEPTAEAAEPVVEEPAAEASEEQA